MVMMTNGVTGKPDQPDVEYDLSAKMEEQSRNLKLLRKEVELISNHLRRQRIAKKECQRREEMTYRGMSDLLTRERQKLASEKSTRNQQQLDKVKIKLEEQKSLTNYRVKHDESSKKLQKLHFKLDHTTE